MFVAVVFIVFSLFFLAYIVSTYYGKKLSLQQRNRGIFRESERVNRIYKIYFNTLNLKKKDIIDLKNFRAISKEISIL